MQGVGAAGGCRPHAGGARVTPVPVNVTPGSVSVLLSLSVGVGKPVAVTVKVPAVPTVKAVTVGAGERRRLVDVCETAEEVLVVKFVSPP